MPQKLNDSLSITGRTRFERLFLIGKCSTILSLDALRLAVAEAKSGKDVERYELAVEALGQATPNDPDAVLDQRWVDVAKQTVRAETDKLEHELKGYKNNLIKESIRVGSPRTSNKKEETDLYRWVPMT